MTEIAYETYSYSTEALADEEPWGTDLMNFVLLNQDVIVSCPWMGGAEVSLGEAMTTYNYPPNMTENDVPSVMAIVRELLANPVAIEETEEKDDLDETVVTEDADEIEADKTIEEAAPIQNVHEQRPKQPVAELTKVTQSNHSTPVQSQTSEKDSVMEKVSSVEPEPFDSSIVTNLTEDPRTLVAESDKPEKLTEEDVSTSADEDDVGLLSQSPETESVQFETPQIPKLEIEAVSENDFDFSDKDTSIGGKLERVDDSEQAEMELQEPTDTEALVVDSLVSNQTIAPERPVLDEPLIEEIGHTLIEIESIIEASKPKEIAAANEILKKIIILPDVLNNSTSEKLINETEVQDEIEELFVELFDRLGIDYTPELVESLARFTIRWRLEKIEGPEKKIESYSLPSDYGTHEIIQKLLAGLSRAKRLAANAFFIGKSAVQLYHYDFPAELRKRLASQAS